MKTKIKIKTKSLKRSKQDSGQENTYPLHPSKLPNFLHPTPPQLHKAHNQHLKFTLPTTPKLKMSTKYQCHCKPKTNRTLKRTYLHPPSTNHPSSNHRSLLSTLHAAPINNPTHQSNQPTKPTLTLHIKPQPFRLPNLPIHTGNTNHHSTKITSINTTH